MRDEHSTGAGAAGATISQGADDTGRPSPGGVVSDGGGASPPVSPWLTVRGAARRAQVGRRIIYREVAAGRLKAARVSARRDLRIHAEWLDAWLAASATIVNPTAPGRAHTLRLRR